MMPAVPWPRPNHERDFPRWSQGDVASTGATDRFNSPSKETPVEKEGVRLEAGRLLYEQRCVLCHTSGQPGIPPQAAIAALTTSRIVEALTDGPMKPQGNGLDPIELKSLALYVTSLSKAEKGEKSMETEAVPIDPSGRELYVRHCILCHMPDGSGTPRLVSSLRDSALLRGETDALMLKVRVGSTGDQAHHPTPMPAFASRLNDGDLASLVRYLREAFDETHGR